MILTDAAGTWVGTNGFRLMPGDPLAELPAAATVTISAGGHLTSVTYSWEHPDDGPQEGLLVIGSRDGGGVVAMWGDSWHQQPAPMSLSGRPDSTTSVELAGDHGGGWGWRIGFEIPTAGSFRMRMDNVVPEAHATTEVPAGPYPVMVMDLRRT